MNILLIDHYAGSFDMGMEYRPFYFAKEWEKSNHHTTILAGTYSHVRTKNPDIKDKFSISTEDNIQYIWIKTPKYKSNGLKRFLSMLVFIYRIYFRTKAILRIKKYDVVIASSTYPLDIIPARHISNKCQARLIYEVHDLWPLSPKELGGYSKWHPFIMLMQFAENYAYKKSDKVVSLLPNTMEHMRDHGMDERKWCHIPNGIELSQWKNPENISNDILEKINDIRKKYKHIIGYTGTYGLANALDSYIDAAKLLRNDSVAFVLFGKGPLSDHLSNRVKNEDLINVFIFKPIPKQAIPNLFSHFDFLYIGLQDRPLYRFGISPNKLIDYMMSGKPVILAINAGNDMVLEANCGISVEPENPVALVEAIKKLMSLSANELEMMGQNGRQFILKNHTYTHLAANFIKAIDNSSV